MVGVGSALSWAQATTPANPAATLLSSLRRWCGGLTLAPWNVTPQWSVLGMLVVAAAVLVVIAMTAQGPTAALRQIFDVPEHWRLGRNAFARVWRAARLVTTLLVLTVLSWIGAQCVSFLVENPESRRLELIQLKRGRTIQEFAAEHAVLAATTPLRDVAGLADVLPMLVIAAVVLLVFIQRDAGAASTQIQWRGGEPFYAEHDPGKSWRPWVFAAISVYLLYRLFIRLVQSGGLPVGVCLFVEAALLPALMLLVDGFLLAWILVELRDGEPNDDSFSRFSPARAFQLLPGTLLACFVALPARYVATGLMLISHHVPAPWLTTWLGSVLRWGLGPGLPTLQATSLVVLGIVGVVAWTQGGIGDAVRGYRRTLACEGGRMAVVTMTAAAACGLFSGAAYFLVAALPPSGWVLPAADAYAHYATIPVGLWTLAAFIELAARALPTALPVVDSVAEADSVETASSDLSDAPRLVDPI